MEKQEGKGHNLEKKTQDNPYKNSKSKGESESTGRRIKRRRKYSGFGSDDLTDYTPLFF